MKFYQVACKTTVQQSDLCAAVASSQGAPIRHASQHCAKAYLRDINGGMRQVSIYLLLLVSQGPQLSLACRCHAEPT